MVMFAAPGQVWAIYLIAGQARFADDSPLTGLAAGDTALLVGGDERRRFVLDGGGEVLVIRLEPIAA
jgi:hypothetical protein